MLIAAIIGTVFNIVGPKILGLATTKLFDGLIAKIRFQLSPHPPTAVAPGVDFGYIGTVLLILLGLYIISAHLHVHAAVYHGGRGAKNDVPAAQGGG